MFQEPKTQLFYTDTIKVAAFYGPQPRAQPIPRRCRKAQFDIKKHSNYANLLPNLGAPSFRLTTRPTNPEPVPDTLSFQPHTKSSLLALAQE
jgi:hypothetical protein